MRVELDDDLMSHEATQDPYTYFGRLREADPVHWNERHRSWLVTRYADVLAGFRHPALSAERMEPLRGDARMADVTEILRRWMVFRDPPDHTALRRAAAAAFTPRRVAALEPRIASLVGELLEPLADRPAFDLVADFAFPLPAMVIADLLGVPVEDRRAFKAWSDDLKALIFGALDRPDRHERARRGVLALRDYFGELLRDRARRPAGDLASAFLQAGALGREDVVATCVLLLFAGHETTTGLIASGTLALLRHPGELRRLRDDASLAPAAVEELLRYDGPAKLSPRWVHADFELRGRRVLAGQRVLLVQAAANRDPRRFADPDQLWLDRPDNQHVAFGYGIHYCLGAPLARIEGRIAIPEILRRLPRLAPAPGPPRWQRTLLGRGLEALTVLTGAG